MSQIYKIFFGGSQILITDEKAFPKLRSFLMVRVNKKADIEYVCSLFKKKMAFKNTLLISSNPKSSFQVFKKQFDEIKYAGGLVWNKKGHLLVIYKNKKWDLPKGKVEPGEKKKKAAEREVMEECGVSKLKVKDKKVETYQLKRTKGRLVLKRTTWYEMHCPDGQKLVPYTEEGITFVKWVDREKLAGKIPNSHHVVKDLMTELSR